jgi:hypothetical protein
VRLCEHSFLSLWSYPGVYRDQTSGRGSKGSKEVCDLLVVFENHILIFSDKHCKFPNTGSHDLDWSRWVRKAVLESGEQIYGAERWIRTHSDRLFIDPECKQPFPIELPDMTKVRFHRILVAHGASERCHQELGGSGSLMIHSSTVGKDHLSKLENGGIPFSVGQIDPKRGYVHIFDDTSLNIVLSTLDTISDFTGYLEKKEKLFDNGIVVGAAGEEELLAYYLKDLNENGEHDFIIQPGINGIILSEGFWDHFIKSPERQSQIDANIISYSWDALIEKFSFHIMNDTQYIRDPLGARNQEKTVRFLAREPRTRRRMLARSLIELMEKYPKSYKSTRVMVPSKPGDPYYVFLLIPHFDSIPQSEYREARSKLLEAYCMVTKLTFPAATDIVGIATESGTDEYRSEDALYLDARIWTPDQQIEATSLQADLGLLTKVTKHATKELEYPISAIKPRKRHKRKTH